MRWIAAISLALIVSACVKPYELVKPGQHKVDGVYQIKTENNWSQANIFPFKPWTIDGDNLQTLMLIGGLKEGETIFAGVKGEKVAPKFDTDMRETDIAELVEGSFEFLGMSDFTATNIRPAPFDKLQGFRFDYEFIGASGLRYRGEALGAVDDQQRLNLILYSGARLHYFEKHRGKVEKIFASVKML